LAEGSRVLVLQNKVTGEMVQIDPEKARLRRMRKRVFAWGRLFPQGGWGILVTLTYRPGVEPSPRDISAFLRRVRRALGTDLLGYCWVAEVQKRGALHYHVVLVVRGPGIRIPKPDEVGWWPHGMSRVERARNPVGYLGRYVGKEDQKRGLPAGFRMFAVVWRAVLPVARLLLRISGLPAWLLDRLGVDEILASGECPRRWPGRGWIWRNRVFRSPWVLVGVFFIPISGIS